MMSRGGACDAMPLRRIELAALALALHWGPMPIHAATMLGNDALVERVDPAIVRVLNTTARGSGSGSGFVLNGQGHIATNQHVIEGWRSLEVKQGGSRYPAEVVWSSKMLDLAVLRVQYGSFTGLPLSLAAPAPLDAVVAFGHPGISATDQEPTRTTGTVNKRVYRGSWTGSGELRIIEHSAPVNPGNSGGPLVDRCARVIGVNTQAPLVQLAPGLRVASASGVYRASHIAELARELDSLGIPYEAATEPCEVSLAPGASEEELENLRREIEEQSRRAQAQDADQRAAAEARLAELRAELQTELEKAAQERDAERHAETHSEIAHLREEFSRRWVGGLAISAVVALLLALLAFYAFASFRRSIVLVAGRMRDGARSVVRPRSAAPKAIGASAADSVRIRIGRSSDMDVTLDSGKVSRFHAELASAPGGYRIVDQGSTNGTRVFRSGRWRDIATAMVAPDERLEFGDQRTTADALVRMAAPARMPEPPPGAASEGTADDRLEGPVKRDRRTGEIMRD